MSEILHGGGLDTAIERYGGERGDWLDLSTGINPNPYPVAELDPGTWSQLPDRGAEENLLEAARHHYQVPEHFEIVAAPGTQALIQLLPGVVKAKEVAIVSPTYAEHAHVWRSRGCSVSEVSRIDQLDADVIVVVNPNNPTAEFRSPLELAKIAQKAGTLIVDEAFCNPCVDVTLLSDPPANAIVLKSFGKFFGLAGIRLGFAICAPEPAGKFRELLGPWSVSGPALAIGMAALRDDAWVSETEVWLTSASEQLATILTEFGLEIEGINPLFVYTRYEHAQALYDHLAKAHILVRPFEDRKEHLRFGLCSGEVELNRLREALEGFVDR